MDSLAQKVLQWTVKECCSYISDGNNHCIQVFTRDGQLVYLFREKGSGQGKLYSRYGVCVDASYVYVTNHNNKRVSVFTKVFSLSHHVVRVISPVHMECLWIVMVLYMSAVDTV